MERRYLIGSFLPTSSPFNDPDKPTLLYCSSGNRFTPDLSFAPSSLSLSCSWKVLQDLVSDHLPMLLTVPLSLVFPNKRSQSFNFQKVLWDDFAFYFDFFTLFFCRGILVSFLCCCFLYFSDSECGQILHSFQPHQTPP